MTPPPEVEPAPATGAPELPLFVYGTLQPGEVRWFALEGRTVGEPVPDAVAGRLYDTGWGYPAWVPGPDGEVPGVLLELAPATAEATWEHVCEIEGGVEGDYGPVIVLTAGGVRALAFPHRSADGSLPASFRPISAWRHGPVA